MKSLLSGGRSRSLDGRWLAASAATLGLLLLALTNPVSAHVGSEVKHLWKEHLKPKLAKPGEINKASNPVDWTKLKNVPADLADGDDVGSGDITSVAAGPGLTGGATAGDATLAVDTSTVQSRITGSCAQDKALQSVAPNGTVTCGGGPAGREAHLGALFLSQEPTEVMRMSLPAGYHFITAKTVLYYGGSGETSGGVMCRLRVLEAYYFDDSAADFNSSIRRQTIVMQFMAALPEGGTVVLECSDNDPGEHTGVAASSPRINAISLGSMVDVSPGN